mmetsp:Transcript_62582/g.150917  ORF Transcript_62582/g.150917 Transcript_62582/m.150917 type:complete len:216 (-) Transcript_62582:865-1512(-)
MPATHFSTSDRVRPPFPSVRAHTFPLPCRSIATMRTAMCDPSPRTLPRPAAVLSPQSVEGRDAGEVLVLFNCAVIVLVALHEDIDGGGKNDQAQGRALGHPRRRVQAGDEAAQMEGWDVLFGQGQMGGDGADGCDELEEAEDGHYLRCITTTFGDGPCRRDDEDRHRDGAVQLRVVREREGHEEGESNAERLRERRVQLVLDELGLELGAIGHVE